MLIKNFVNVFLQIITNDIRKLRKFPRILVAKSHYWCLAPQLPLQISDQKILVEKKVVEFDFTNHSRFSPSNPVSFCSYTGTIRNGLY